MTGGGLNNVRYNLFGSLGDDVLAKVIESAKEPLDRKNFVEALLSNKGCTRFAALHFSRATMLLQAGMKTDYERAMNGTLRQLMIYDIAFRNADAVMKLISNGSLRALQLLSLYMCHIGDNGVKSLSDAIAMGAMGALKELFLGENKIGDEGMKAFSSAIASGSLANLQKLWLHNNQIGDEGMKSFSTALASGSLANLETLSLGDNQIGDEGMESFSTALARGSLPSCKNIYLEGNPASDEATQAVRYALKNRQN
jgi:Ran GTPase-activating protein (RanGAP) involved in mRNA processing and transport